MSDEPAVLFVDDERPNVELFRRLFDEDFRVITVTSASEALRVLGEEEVAVLVSDQRMPGMSGVELLAAAAQTYPHVTRMLLTAYSDRDLLLEAINRGHVHDYVLKVWDAKDLGLRLRNASDAYLRRVASARAETELELLREEVARREGQGTIIGLDGDLREVGLALNRAVRQDRGVLLRGEPGTGRQLLAREIHRRSRRGAAPFVLLPCAAADVEARLPARLAHAQGGTLFLDEVGRLPIDLQDRLLASALDVRLIASTRDDLRAPLLERLASVEISVPALRERRADFEPLARHILGLLARQLGRSLKLSTRAQAALRAYAWPGNIDELRLVLERATMREHGEELDCGAET